MLSRGALVVQMRRFYLALQSPLCKYIKMKSGIKLNASTLIAHAKTWRDEYERKIKRCHLAGFCYRTL
jgi:hypothetical protein